MNGFVNLLKPPGMTSNDAVMATRRLLKTRRIGHAGTLDPEAAGVLPLGLGKATRLLSMLAEAGKTYWCEWIPGVETDTCDAYGAVTATSRADITVDDLLRVLPGFTGDIAQEPPLYSALKYKGKRMYQWAREGQTPEIPTRTVSITHIEALPSARAGAFALRVRCGGGTYIRSLCRDIGRALGISAHMGMLVREGVGSLSIDDAVTFEALREQAESGAFQPMPMACATSDMPSAFVPDALIAQLLNGAPLPALACKAEGITGKTALYLPDGSLAAIGRSDGTEIRIDIMLLERDQHGFGFNRLHWRL